MARFVKRRPITVCAPIVVLIAMIGGGAVAAGASPHLMGWLSGRLSASSSAPLPAHHLARQVRGPASATTRLSVQGPGIVSIQLAAEDVTPASQLHVTASGYQNGELLVVTIEDMHGQVYARTTGQADDNGALHGTALALPVRLGEGTYQVIVAGAASHRAASALFQMHDIPPTVTLDAYTAAPGQVVGFAGSGFFPEEVVAVSLASSSAPLLSTTASAGGAVSGRLEIPKLHAGTYTLTLLGATSQTPASVGFNIQGFLPWVVLDRYTAAPSEGVGLIAHDFAPGEHVFVYLNAPDSATGTETGTGTPVMSATADPSGQVVVQDTWIPRDAKSGTNMLTLVGQQSKATTTAEFTVQATEHEANQLPAASTTP